MKNRKRIIVSFMIVACMLMAVGFAALTDTLTILGEAEVDYHGANNAFDDDVYFSAAVAQNTEGGDTARVTTDDVDIARFSVRSVSAANDVATFTFTIQNDNEFTAYVKVNNEKSVNNNTEYFEVEMSETEWAIAAGQSVTFTVDVTLLKTPQLDVSSDKITATFGIELDVQDEAFATDSQG